MMNATVLPTLLSVLLILCTAARGQHISGKVLDTETQKPLAYVHVSIESGQKGTVTNRFGNFRLEISKATELQFSSIGYITYYQLVDPAADSSFTVYLIPDTHLLSEVLVFSSRINMLKRPERTPIKVPVLLSQKKSKPIETGSWVWDMSWYPEIREIVMPPQQIGGILYGPFSYFSTQEKQKRKMKAVRKRERDLNAYHTTLEDEDFKQETLKALDMKAREYDSLLIIFNQEHTDLVANASENEAMTMLYLFFQEQLGK
ncbi:hypothetical protein OKW21_003452 [Catalinimonas alkaloidigena]|uniref:carboxypeptidase-like regulatory domain-containing protein n=1 Tax=Catalinimonas alkaloidigena TaxID=1075417 RepID=UPI0024049DBA|nr:carboxypeptidase-like regulatory domain-containing protein [Catalinimonas alkaloidigena]MDF9798189.1 hypothetical protein [Catalinimonas alkaloidigena]